MAVRALSRAILVGKQPRGTAPMSGESLRHEIDEPARGFGHAFQGYTGTLPVDRDHPSEGKADGVCVGSRRNKVRNLGHAQCMGFAVGTVARASPAIAASKRAATPRVR